MRAFFCIELQDEIKAELNGITQPLKRGSEARVSWVRPENLHITVKFLGQIAPERVEELRLAGEIACEGLEAFALELDRVGAFPNRERPRVIWVGSSSPPEQVFQLYRRLERELGPLGFPPEGKTYTSHITLGRVKERNRAKAARLGERLEKVEPFRFVVAASGLTLMESRLDPGGAIYTPIFQVEI